MTDCLWSVCRYDHIKLSSRGAGVGGATLASENHIGGSVAAGAGGGAPVGGGASVRGGAKKPLVLRDRGKPVAVIALQV